MGNLGVVTHGYISLSDLSKEITNAEIVLKKSYYNLSKDTSVNSESVKESRRKLRSLLVRLQKDLSKDSESENFDLPSLFVEQVRTTHKLSLPYFLEDLQNTIIHLQEEGSISSHDINLLDSLSSMIDDETSRMFRKIWR